MRDNSNSLSCLSLGWLALALLLSCQVLTRFSGAIIDSLMGVDYLVVVLLAGAALLSFASSLSQTDHSPPRIFLGLWLALYLRWGFEQYLDFGYRAFSWPWLGIYGVIIVAALLVIVYRPVADLGAIRLTVCAGFLIVFASYLIALLDEYSWFGVSFWPGDTLEAIGDWIWEKDWVVPRLLTYLGLGYLLARRKGLFPGIAISTLIALADSILYWLMYLPHDGPYFEAVSLRIVLEYDWILILRPVLTQVSALVFIALVGAIFTRVPWPFKVMENRPRHTVRRINAPGGPARGYSLSVRKTSGTTSSE